MRIYTIPIFVFLFLLPIVFIAHPVEGLTVDSEKEYLPTQTFPPENYDFTVDLGSGDWDYVISLGNYNDSLHCVFDVVPSGLPIDFFVCDYDNLLEWAAGNTSIERYSVYEDRNFAYWSFLPPYDELWFYVFVNKGDTDIVVWVMEDFDTEPPWVGCDKNSYTTHETPVEISITFTDLWFNISYYSVYLYDSLLAEKCIEPESSGMSEGFSGPFTMEDLQGTSQRLNFTGFTNDTAGHGTDYSFSIQIQEPSPTTFSVTTSTTPTDLTSDFPAIPVFGIVIIGSFVTICCISMNIGERIRNR